MITLYITKLTFSIQWGKIRLFINGATTVESLEKSLFNLYITIKYKNLYTHIYEVWNKAGQRLMEFCQENTLVIANTFFHHKRRLYRWTSPDGQHRNPTDYILCSQRWRSSIQSTKTRPGADCSSDHELLIIKFRFKLKNVGKTIRPFRYDLIKSLMIIQWK